MFAKRKSKDRTKELYIPRTNKYFFNYSSSTFIDQEKLRFDQRYLSEVVKWFDDRETQKQETMKTVSINF